MRPRLLVLAVVLLTACESSTAPSASYGDLSGTYTGVMTGMSQGVALDGAFSLTISQNGGSLSGTDAVVGTLDQDVPVSGTGTLSGTIAAGHNPSVNIVATESGCPNVHSTYSGSYDTANRRLTLTGPLYVTYDDCSIALTYQMTFILNR